MYNYTLNGKKDKKAKKKGKIKNIKKQKKGRVAAKLKGPRENTDWSPGKCVCVSGHLFCNILSEQSVLFPVASCKLTTLKSIPLP